MKLLNVLGRTHPFPVLRIAQLKQWADSDEYKDLLRGEYPTRDEDRHTSVYEQIRQGGESYREDVRKSEDPLTSLVRDIGREVKNAGNSVANLFRRNQDSEGASDSEDQPLN